MTHAITLLVLNGVIGFVLGYFLSSYIESLLHEYISDAPTKSVQLWRRYPILCRVMLKTYFSHHVVHHHQTFRSDHVTQFVSSEDHARVHNALLARGRHGRIIIAGDYANRLHAEGGLVFALPGLIAAACLGLFLPASMAIGAAVALMLPPAFSYWVHPYLHRSFEDGQATASAPIAFFLRTRYGRYVYRNHFLHHRYDGTSNYNLVLGADFLRKRVRRASPQDIEEMSRIGLPLD